MNKETRPSSYPLRLPAELREKLERSAKENNRPLSSEILMRLEATFDEEGERELLDIQELTNKNAKKLAELEIMVADLIRQKNLKE